MWWFSSRAQFLEVVSFGAANRRENERRLATVASAHGWCLVCRQEVMFKVGTGLFFGAQADLREGWLCPSCSCRNRQRLLLHAARQLLLGTRRPEVYLAEAFSALSICCRSEPWALTLSDYVDESLPSGTTSHVAGHSVVHQDLTRTSYGDASFDLVLHAEVVEHVFAWRDVLAETFRITKPSGWTLFTGPFRQDRDTALVRAVLEDGKVRHILSPERHGVPLQDEDALVFQVPGWDLLDALRDVGFSDVRIGWLSDPAFGLTSNNSDHDNYMEPVVFAARH